MSKAKASDDTEQKEASAHEGSEAHLPVLLEFTFTLSTLLVTLIGVAVFVLSYLAGCPLWVALFRAGSAAFLVGLLLWFISWSLAQGAIQALMVAQSEESWPPQRTNEASTMEVKA